MEIICIMTGIVVGFALGIIVDNFLNKKLINQVKMAQKEFDRAILLQQDSLMKKFESDITKTCEEISIPICK